MSRRTNHDDDNNNTSNRIPYPTIPYLEDFRKHEQAAAGEGRLLLLRNLQQPLGKSSHPLGADIALHGLEEQGQEHGGLARSGNLWV